MPVHRPTDGRGDARGPMPRMRRSASRWARVRASLPQPAGKRGGAAPRGRVGVRVGWGGHGGQGRATGRGSGGGDSFEAARIHGMGMGVKLVQAVRQEVCVSAAGGGHTWHGGTHASPLTALHVQGLCSKRPTSPALPASSPLAAVVAGPLPSPRVADAPAAAAGLGAAKHRPGRQLDAGRPARGRGREAPAQVGVQPRSALRRGQGQPRNATGSRPRD